MLVVALKKINSWTIHKISNCQQVVLDFSYCYGKQGTKWLCTIVKKSYLFLVANCYSVNLDSKNCMFIENYGLNLIIGGDFTSYNNCSIIIQSINNNS